MNKYQFALNDVIEVYQELERRVGNNPDNVKDFDDIATLQELVDKETPKPIIVKTYMSAVHDIYGNYLRTKDLCSNCKKEIHYSSYKYCPHCGQKLEWGDDND